MDGSTWQCVDYPIKPQPTTNRPSHSPFTPHPMHSFPAAAAASGGPVPTAGLGGVRGGKGGLASIFDRSLKQHYHSNKCVSGSGLGAGCVSLVDGSDRP